MTFEISGRSVRVMQASKSLIEEIASWCSESGIGRRMSYDIWDFANQSDLSVFLLRWNTGEY